MTFIASHWIHPLGFQPHNTAPGLLGSGKSLPVASGPVPPGHCADKHVLGCSMSSKGAGVEEAKASGLYSRHVYSLLKVMKLGQTGMGSDIKIGSAFRMILVPIFTLILYVHPVWCTFGIKKRWSGIQFHMFPPFYQNELGKWWVVLSAFCLMLSL